MPELMGLSLMHDEEATQTLFDSSEPVTMSAAHIQGNEDNSMPPLSEGWRNLNYPKGQLWSKAIEELRKNENVELSITRGQGVTEFKVIMKEATCQKDDHILSPGDRSVDRKDEIPSAQKHGSERSTELVPYSATGPESRM